MEVPFRPSNPFVSFVLETYGRPNRNSAVQCDCERDGGAGDAGLVAEPVRRRAGTHGRST